MVVLDLEISGRSCANVCTANFLAVLRALLGPTKSVAERLAAGSKPSSHLRFRRCHRQFVIAISMNNEPSNTTTMITIIIHHKHHRSCHCHHHCGRIATTIGICISLSCSCCAVVCLASPSHHRHHQHHHQHIHHARGN